MAQEHLAERGLNAGYILTKSLDHWQPHHHNIVWVGAERSFGSLDASVPYVLLGSVAGGYHTLRQAGWAFFPTLEVGAGIRYWNAERSWLVAPVRRQRKLTPWRH